MPRSNDGRWTATCQICGKEFQQKRKTQVTCSVACRGKLPHNTGGVRVKSGMMPRQCQNPECGKDFVPVREVQIACNRQCLVKCPSYIEAQRRHDAKPERRERQNELRRLKPQPDKHRRYNLRRYGLSPGDFDRMLVAQDGKCKLCGAVPKGHQSGGQLHVDHDHVTGQVRDLLCGSCNPGIGYFHDDPALFRKAADYIEHHRAVAQTT